MAPLAVAEKLFAFEISTAPLVMPLFTFSPNIFYPILYADKPVRFRYDPAGDAKPPGMPDHADRLLLPFSRRDRKESAPVCL